MSKNAYKNVCAAGMARKNASVDSDAAQAGEGVASVGQHLIVDFWGAQGIDDAARLEGVIRRAVLTSGATLLHIHLHRFSQGNGITGVALLAESHISVHSWPEHDYSAFDIFMCGDCDPLLALEVLRTELQPLREKIRHIPRG